MNINVMTNYELIQQKELKDLKSEGYLLRHKKSGARVLLMENDDENKVFTIGFRTPPEDSTGLPHILEHSVLCGSKNFPVKDPFVELVKGSLSTFLNAMTYPDKTVYPVASCNEKDFQNLMHVYMDAVFYPNIYEHDEIFRQEGWSYNLESKEDALTYNGVVYNEMKGAFSSPEGVLDRVILNSLFPDTSYANESGGDPEVIPKLMYEQFLEFHSRYYHPSNSYIYLYGDMDMEEKLEWLDREYLSKFDTLQIDSAIKEQAPFDAVKEIEMEYSIASDESEEDNTYLSYNKVIGTSLDRELYLAFQVLDYALLSAPGAPLKKVLVDAGIGKDIMGSYDNGIYQPIFSIIAKNANLEQKEEFLSIVERTLSEIVKKGMDTKALEAGINYHEFRYREADFGNYPKGLMYGLQIFDSWLYDENKPFIHIQANDTFAFLKKQVGTDYFEKIIEKYLLKNPHATFVSVQPKVGLTTLMEEEEKKKLEDYMETLSDEQKEALVKETEELKKYQEEPTPSEDLKCIPLLTREDMKKEAQPFKNEMKEMVGVPVLHHDIFTNGIEYFRCFFDVKDLEEYTPYLSLLSELISAMDTEKYTKLELSNEILLHAGGISTDLVVYANRHNDDYRYLWEISGKALTAETEKVFDLLAEMLTNTKLFDEKRLYEIIAESRSIKQSSLLSAGHTTAVGRAMAYMKKNAYLTEYIRGIAYYDFLCDLEEHFDERKENLISVLQALAKKVFVKERLSVDLTSGKEGLKPLENGLSRLIDRLPDSAEEKLLKPEYSMKPIVGNEGFKTAGKVQYVARVGNSSEKGIAYNGVNKVLKTILGYDYLWNEVRVKGGAYGVMCAFTDLGNGYMVSYRDPNLAETNEVFEKVPAYLEAFDADERDMMKYIIGTVSELDTPLTPRAEGRRSSQAWLTDITFEQIQKERDEVLSADCEQVREAAKMVSTVLSDGYICAIGSEGKVEDAKELFNEIRVLN